MELDVRGETAFVGTGGRMFDPEAETVVFIHGVAQDHSIWVLPSRHFARRGLNVLAVDLPGHGRSTGDSLPTIEAMASWVVEVLDEAGVGDAAIVGHSMGSLVALDLAAKNSERARALVMVGVSVPLRVAEPLMDSARTGSHDAIDMLNYWSFSKMAQMGGSPTPGLWMVGNGIRLMERTSPDVIHRDLHACDTYSPEPDLIEGVTCPTLLLLAEKDRMTPAKGASQLQDRIPNIETVTFGNAGHPVLAERSDEVLDELVRLV